MNMPANIDTHASAATAGVQHPRVVIIGAGMSGLLMAIKLLKAAGNTNFRIYEKAAKLGGTWRENTYPNIACDISAPAYTYSFEPNTEWNWRFGRGDEIQRYFEGSAPSTALRESHHVRLPRSPRRAGTVRNGRSAWGAAKRAADVLVSAVGALHIPRYPDIAGLGSFAGPRFHTARWDHTVDIRDQRVGIIGTGSTAAQVVPGIVDKVSELYLFQRTRAVGAAGRRTGSTPERSQRRRKHRWLARLDHRLNLQMFQMFGRAVRRQPLPACGSSSAPAARTSRPSAIRNCAASSRPTIRSPASGW